MSREAKEFSEEAADAGEEGLSQAKETIDKYWSKAKKAGEQVEDKIAACGQDSWKAVQKFAEKRPMQVAAIALAVGMILGGALFASSSDR